MNFKLLSVAALLLLSSSVFADDKKVTFNCEVKTSVSGWYFWAGSSDIAHFQVANLDECKQHAAGFLGQMRKVYVTWLHLTPITSAEFEYVAPDKTTKGTVDEGNKSAAGNEITRPTPGTVAEETQFPKQVPAATTQAPAPAAANQGTTQAH